MPPTPPTSNPADSPKATPTEIDANVHPFVRLEFLQDTIHNFARRRKGDKPDVWYPAAEAQRMILAGTARIDTSAKTWTEQLEANAPREGSAVVDNGPNAGRQVPIVGRRAGDQGGQQNR